MILYHVLKCSGGTLTLLMGKKQWKMNCDLDAPPPGEQAQTSTVWGLTFIKIEAWQFKLLLMNLMNVQSTNLLCKIWIREWCMHW
jgi:hypothetical protein